ncbi:hypothetical protein ACHAWU_008458 [Discostella pseudostelligera]|uniref:Uncharacterized protein n=1 Tax=Discostella pseudostelligera TaxID=259834 RepID=A0ABD3M547_9STRA
MVSSTKRASLSIVAAVSVIGKCESFMPNGPSIVPGRTTLSAAAASESSPPLNTFVDTSAHPCRRSFVKRSVAATLGTALMFNRPSAVIATDENLASILGHIKEAKNQIEIIPDLIKSEKWDAASLMRFINEMCKVRAILIKPPLANMWTSGGQSKLLKNYADAIGNELPNGDEIAALELREEVISHLRYLDMAVYNNVFNPIATEGTTGATKELIRSYYEDPINEWNALKSAIDQLIGLASL